MRREPVTSGVPLALIEEIYRRSYQRFLRLALAMLGDRELAGDAVQEAFARAVRSRTELREDSKVEAWLWSTLTNVCRDEQRRGLRRSSDPPGDEPHRNGSVGEHAGLRAAIAALPERQRTMLFLRHYADLDYQRIADALSVERGTVAATLHAAHASLRETMKEARND